MPNVEPGVSCEPERRHRERDEQRGAAREVDAAAARMIERASRAQKPVLGIDRLARQDRAPRAMPRRP